MPASSSNMRPAPVAGAVASSEEPRRARLWGSAKIATHNGTVLFPPWQGRTTQWRPVPVYLGVTVRPGDTDADVLARAREQFGKFFDGYKDSELKVMTQQL